MAVHHPGSGPPRSTPRQRSIVRPIPSHDRDMRDHFYHEGANPMSSNNANNQTAAQTNDEALVAEIRRLTAAVEASNNLNANHQNETRHLFARAMGLEDGRKPANSEFDQSGQAAGAAQTPTEAGNALAKIRKPALIVGGLIAVGAGVYYGVKNFTDWLD